MELILIIVFVAFIGSLLYCGYDTIRHADKTISPKPH